MPSEFISLHTHSDNSLLDGFGTYSEYIVRVAELGQRGLGGTDHGNTLGTFDLIKGCRAAGITPVPGVEFYVAPENPEGARAKRPIFYRGGGQGDVSGRGAYLHLTVWAVNNTGVSNLFKLSTLSAQEQHFYMKPRIDFEMLTQHSEGLVVATGCPSSEISTRFLLGQDDKAYEYAHRLRDVFGQDRLFVEVMNHNMSIDLERRLIPKQVKLAKDLGLELLATNDSHYAKQTDAKHHEEMLAIQSGSFMSQKRSSEGGTRFNFDGEEYYLKTAEEMAKLFPERDFPRALSNTIRVAEMAEDINFSFNPNLRPHPIVPDGMTEVEYFSKLIKRGFKERYGNAPADIQRQAIADLQHEFNVINSSDYIGYMLTVYEYINWARDEFSTRDADGNILAPSVGVGRGSVGGSRIAYVLKISEIDPIRHGLFFERFLSEGRGPVYKLTYDDGSEMLQVASDVVNRVDEATGETSSTFTHRVRPGDLLEVQDRGDSHC